MLDLKPDRAAVTPKDAATVILVRDAAALEVFCVERSKESRFLGGAVVFPGGKVDPADADPAFAALATQPHPRTARFANDATHAHALAVAAARETLEEAAILPAAGAPVTQDELFALRARLAAEGSAPAILAFLRERGLRLDLAALHPLARWITPEAEARRYDARFFLAIAPPGLDGAHDEHETMASFWAPPADILRRFDAGEVQLAPPTHRTLALLAECPDARAAVELAETASLDPICPRLVAQKDGEDGETMALVLPGDRDHEIAEPRIAGASRYVLRGQRWLPEDAP